MISRAAVPAKFRCRRRVRALGRYVLSFNNILAAIILFDSLSSCGVQCPFRYRRKLLYTLSFALGTLLRPSHPDSARSVVHSNQGLPAKNTILNHSGVACFTLSLAVCERTNVGADTVYSIFSALLCL